jgi:hypothetical protein
VVESSGLLNRRRVKNSTGGSNPPLSAITKSRHNLHARAVFTDGYSKIEFAGREALNGRDALRCKYIIALLGSGWTISNRGLHVRTGAHNAFWVDPKTLDVMRLDMHTDHLPPDFANTAAVTRIDYGRVLRSRMYRLMSTKRSQACRRGRRRMRWSSQPEWWFA